MPGNLIYKGQLLEKRGGGFVEALGVGYFFSKLSSWKPFAHPAILHGVFCGELLLLGSCSSTVLGGSSTSLRKVMRSVSKEGLKSLPS